MTSSIQRSDALSALWSARSAAERLLLAFLGGVVSMGVVGVLLLAHLVVPAWRAHAQGWQEIAQGYKSACAGLTISADDSEKTQLHPTVTPAMTTQK